MVKASDLSPGILCAGGCQFLILITFPGHYYSISYGVAGTLQK